jgi:hypothetical protein
MPARVDLPEQGTADDLVPRLVRYVDGRRDGWSRSVRGATADEIAGLERASGLAAQGRRFPASYRHTLGLFGHDDAGLLASLQGAYGDHRTVRQLAALYAGLGAELDPLQPIVLGCSIGDYLAFDMEDSDGDREPPVVHEGTHNPYAESWEKLVFQQAALRCDAWTAPEDWWASASPKALRSALARTGTSVAAELDAVADARGLARAWFGDANHVYLSGAGPSVWASVEHGILFYVTGSEAPEVRGLAEELAVRFGAGAPKRTPR